jgi:CPA1 family monovalent cation:H+ antiporter
MTPLELALAFMLVAAAVSIAAERLGVPYTIALVLTGLAAGSLHGLRPLHLTTEELLVLFILPLLFEGSLHLDPGDLRAYGRLILLLAIPGTVIAAAGIAAAALSSLPLRAAVLLGAIAAAIDPVSVIALVREAGLDPRLGAVLEGEAVLNDGVAIVLFTLAAQPATAGAAAAAGTFLWLLAGGALVGGALGAGVAYGLGHVRQPLVEVLGSLILAAAAFIAAEHLGTSGVIAVVVAGTVFGGYGHRHLTAAGKEALRTFWEVIAFLANSGLFLFIGLAVPGGLLLHYAGLIVAVALAALAVRALVVYPAGRMMARAASPVPVAWRHVLVWSGLRGGVAIALVLGLPRGLPGREAVEAAVFGLVLFTLVGQGLAVRPVMRWTGLLRTRDGSSAV